jgi:hypothetical protein
MREISIFPQNLDISFRVPSPIGAGIKSSGQLSALLAELLMRRFHDGFGIEAKLLLQIFERRGRSKCVHSYDAPF